MHELKTEYTIVIVTHNMQQAARVSDMTAFFYDRGRRGRQGRTGSWSSSTRRAKIFTTPGDKRTEDYVTGRFGSMRVEYQERLHLLESSLQEQGALCLRAVRGAVDALTTQDVELCDEVIAFDDEIDERYHRIEKMVEEVLALETPVAGDLRLVLAVLHNSIHLERIGDQSVTIAKLTKLSARSRAATRARRRAARDGRPLRGDAHDRARLLRPAQRRASPLARRARRARSTARTTGSPTRCSRWRRLRGQQEWGMRMIIVSRCLERVGDNAVDIGEQTVFIATGEFERVQRREPLALGADPEVAELSAPP